MKRIAVLLLSLLFSVSVLAKEPDTVSQGTEAITQNPETKQVSYLGPEGTYTEEAAQFWFQDGEALIPKETVADAIADVLSGDAKYAVIPQENTLGGAVVNYVDALIAA